MAIFRLSAQVITRGKGHSVVAAAAYRSRSVLEDKITQQVQDYSPKAGDLLFAGIYAPKGAPTWAQDREQLWNEVERNENRRNSQLAREIQLALPHELTEVQQRYAVQDFVRDNFVRKGLVADVAIHRPHDYGDERNVHAHILITLRQIDSDGWAQHKQRDGKRDDLESWREQWAKTANRHLERHGHEARIDHRSLQDQGSDRLAQIHLGKTAAAMERDGTSSDRGDQLCRIAAENAAKETAALQGESAMTRPLKQAEQQTDLSRRTLFRDFSAAVGQLGRTMAGLLLRVLSPQDDFRARNAAAKELARADRPHESLLERLTRERPVAVANLRSVLPLPERQKEPEYDHGR